MTTHDDFFSLCNARASDRDSGPGARRAINTLPFCIDCVQKTWLNSSRFCSVLISRDSKIGTDIARYPDCYQSDLAERGGEQVLSDNTVDAHLKKCLSCHS